MPATGHCWADEEMNVATGALPLAMVADEEPAAPATLETAVHLGDVTISGAMRPILEKVCSQTQDTDPANAAKAMELLTALEMQKEITNGIEVPMSRTPAPRYTRPRTAGAALQRRAHSALPDKFAYETSYNYYFTPQQPRPSKAIRPASTNAMLIPPGRALRPTPRQPVVSHYTHEFSSKETPRRLGCHTPSGGHRTPVHRAASASGTRSNNPQPSQDFLIWRQRRPLSATARIEDNTMTTPVAMSAESENHTPVDTEIYDRAMRGKCRSTYQSDFLGMKPTFDYSDRHGATVDARENKKQQYDTTSISRTSYPAPPTQPSHLRVPTTRYASSEGKVHYNKGIIPGVIKEGPHMHTYQRTTYDRDVNDRALRMMGVADLSAVSAQHNRDALARVLANDSGVDTTGERQSMEKLLREMDLRTRPYSIPAPAVARHVRLVRSQETRPETPEWISKWEGP